MKIQAFPLQGHILAGRYQILEIIGYGGFGTTYRGKDLVLDQDIAVKEYCPQDFAMRLSDGADVTPFEDERGDQYRKGLARFIEEARKLAAFRSEKGIVRIIDCVEANHTAYLVMEYLEGILLEKLLRAENRIPEDESVSLLLPVMKSLGKVHRENIIHREICPANLFLCNDGLVKLIDFGASRDISTGFTRSLSVTVRTGYSPEEQYRGSQEQGPYTDVYALSATLYRMITGVTPVDAMERLIAVESGKKDPLVRPKKLNPSISSVTEAAILSGLNIRIADRPQTVDDFLRALQAQKPTNQKKQPVSKAASSRWPMSLTALFTCLILLLTAFAWAIFSGRVRFDSESPLLSAFYPDTVQVPNLQGLSQDEAFDALHQAGLVPKIQGSTESAYVNADSILLQSPSPGHRVRINSEVALTISAGMPVIPYVVWEDADSALARLISAGITDSSLTGIASVYEYSDDVPSGTVMRQSITDRMPASAEILTLTISAGPSYELEALIDNYYLFFPDVSLWRVGDAYCNMVRFGLYDASGQTMLSNEAAAGYDKYLVNYRTRRIQPLDRTTNNYVVLSSQLDTGWYFWLIVRDGTLVTYFEEPFYLQKSASALTTDWKEDDYEIALYPDGIPVPNGCTKEFSDSLMTYTAQYMPWAYQTDAATDRLIPLGKESLPSDNLVPLSRRVPLDCSVQVHALSLRWGAQQNAPLQYTTAFPLSESIRIYLMDYTSGKIAGLLSGPGAFTELSPGIYYCFPISSLSLNAIYSSRTSNSPPLFEVVETPDVSGIAADSASFNLVYDFPSDTYSPEFTIQVPGAVEGQAVNLSLRHPNGTLEEVGAFILDQNGFLTQIRDAQTQIIQFSAADSYQLVLLGKELTPPEEGGTLTVETGEAVDESAG